MPGPRVESMVLLLTAGLMAVGCSSAGKPDGTVIAHSNQPERVADVSLDEPPANDAMTVAEIQALTDADAEFFRQRPDLVNPDAYGATSASTDIAIDDRTARDAAPTRRTNVDWGRPNDPTTVVASSAPTEAPSSTTQDEFEQSVMFMDPPGTVEVDALPDAPPLSTSLDAISTQLESRPMLLNELTRELYGDAALGDTPMKELIALAGLSMVDSDRAIDPAMIPNLTEREREIFAELQAFFAQLGRDLEGDVDSEAVIVASVDQLRKKLVVQPQLTINRVELCTAVRNFGNFDRITNRSFLARQNTRFGLYVEVENYLSEINATNEWITELSREIVIYTDRDGIPVMKEDWQLAVDRSTKKRTDFFLAQVIEIPSTLGVGKYHLKIRVRDEKTKAIAESSIDFTLVADPKLAVPGK
ncbi:MAG: hypothetical protein AAF432_12585 [Planctomycetota bacterium]